MQKIDTSVERLVVTLIVSTQWFLAILFYLAWKMAQKRFVRCEPVSLSDIEPIAKLTL